MQYVLWSGTAICALIVIVAEGWRPLAVGMLLSLLAITLVFSVFSGWVAVAVASAAILAVSEVMRRLRTRAHPPCR